MRRPTLATAALVAALTACSGNSTGSNPPPSNGTVFSFIPCTTPGNETTLMLAVQDGTGPWTPLTLANGSYTDTLHASTARIAQVYGSASYGAVRVFYVLASEANEVAQAFCDPAGANWDVPVTNLAADDHVRVGLGYSTRVVSGPGDQTASVVAITNPADLLASLMHTGSSSPTRLIFRRGIDPASVAPVDFTSSESVTPTIAHLTVTGVGSDTVDYYADWYWSDGLHNEIAELDFPDTLPTAYWGLPSAVQAPGDLYELDLYVLGAVVGGVKPARELDIYHHGASDRTLAMAPLPAAPTITVGSTTPYVRMRLQWPAGSDSKLLQLYYQDGSGSAEMLVTAGYLGGGGADITFPDLSGLPGWNPAWVPAVGTSGTGELYDNHWNVNSAGYPSPSDGLMINYNKWYAPYTP
jgi:hypothetical protein